MLDELLLIPFIPRMIKGVSLSLELGLTEVEEKIFYTFDVLTFMGRKPIDLDKFGDQIEYSILELQELAEENNENIDPNVELHLRQLYVNSRFREKMLDRYYGEILPRLNKYTFRDVWNHMSSY